MEEDTKSLTIKIATSCNNNNNNKTDLSSSSSSPNLVFLSPLNSPLLSPPSSAFVSALQSPYISPRASTTLVVPNPPPPTPPLSHPSPPVSYCGSLSDDIPSTSYTPPTEERSDFSDDPSSAKLKIVSCVPINGPESLPRVSFSFPVPRISFAKGSVSSPASNAKLRSCDVFIGFHGQNPSLQRFCKWLKSELELQGIACFVADRAKYSDSQSHEIADRVICSVTFGAVVITSSSLLNHHSLEEIRFFAQKKNLIPIFFDTDPGEIMSFLDEKKECKEAVDGLMRSHEFKLETDGLNWRSCVTKAAGIMSGKLGRRSVAERGEIEGFEEMPFQRNRFFVGREKEMLDMETALFGFGDCPETEGCVNKSGTPPTPEGFAEDEEETKRKYGRYISLEMNSDCKEPKLEAWVEPVIGRNSLNSLKRAKCKKSRSGKYKTSSGSSCTGSSSIVCITGSSGIGKTELALEFAHKYAHRYKLVLWVGGEARYFRQNILNLSVKLGLDVSADAEKERGRIRSFEEQEAEAFKRVKRELFRDMPYLLIIDNLENEKEWWDGKDLHDLIPRNTGGSHVIITTRLARVMNSDSLQLQPLPMSDAMLLIKGRRKRDYPAEEFEYLGKFEEELRRSSFGLWVIGCLLSELAIAPSALFEAIKQMEVNDEGITSSDSSSGSCLSAAEEDFCKNNPFLMKLLAFCNAVLQRANGLASRMLRIGAWFAPAPVPAALLAAAARNIPTAKKNPFGKWSKCLSFTFPCCSSSSGGGGCLTSQKWKSEEEESALLLVKLGLAQRANKQQQGGNWWIQFHPITQIFAKKRDGGLVSAKATVQGLRRIPSLSPEMQTHLWASAFLVFGFKSEPPLVQLKATEMVIFIKKTALPLAIKAFAEFSRCNSALELLKVCTNVLEEVEKSFVSQIQDWCHGSLCWKKKKKLEMKNQRVDEYVWQEVTLLKATLLETRAKLLLRGGHFDGGEEVCRTCISIRTVMLGHNHAQTLAAQETLAKLVRLRSKV